MTQKGFAPLLLIITLVGILVIASGAYYLGTKKASTPNQQIISQTPQPTLKPSSTPGINLAAPSEDTDWKVMQGKGFTLSYPPTWIPDSPTDPGFKSSDYKMGESGYAEVGYGVVLNIGNASFNKNAGLVSSENTTWLGQQATLNVYKYEGDDLVLTTKYNGTVYELVMYASDDATRETNKELFLKAANTLKIN